MLGEDVGGEEEYDEHCNCHHEGASVVFVVVVVVATHVVLNSFSNDGCCCCLLFHVDVEVIGIGLDNIVMI